MKVTKKLMLGLSVLWIASYACVQSAAGVATKPRPVAEQFGVGKIAGKAKTALQKVKERFIFTFDGSYNKEILGVSLKLINPDYREEVVAGTREPIAELKVRYNFGFGGAGDPNKPFPIAVPGQLSLNAVIADIPLYVDAVPLIRSNLQKIKNSIAKDDPARESVDALLNVIDSLLVLRPEGVFMVKLASLFASATKNSAIAKKTRRAVEFPGLKDVYPETVKLVTRLLQSPLTKLDSRGNVVPVKDTQGNVVKITGINVFLERLPKTARDMIEKVRIPNVIDKVDYREDEIPLVKFVDYRIRDVVALKTRSFKFDPDYTLEMEKKDSVRMQFNPYEAVMFYLSLIDRVKNDYDEAFKYFLSNSDEIISKVQNERVKKALEKNVKNYVNLRKAASEAMQAAKKQKTRASLAAFAKEKKNLLIAKCKLMPYIVPNVRFDRMKKGILVKNETVRAFMMREMIPAIRRTPGFDKIEELLNQILKALDPAGSITIGSLLGDRKDELPPAPVEYEEEFGDMDFSLD